MFELVRLITIFRSWLIQLDFGKKRLDIRNAASEANFALEINLRDKT